MKDETSPASTASLVAPARRATWRQRVWNRFTTPWFSSLLAQVAMCRVLLASVTLLGGAHLFGWSLWPCFFASVTGLPCPGCGMTRSVTCLLNGEWNMAMAFHPFSPGFVALGGLLTWVALVPTAWRKPVIEQVKTVEKRTALPTIFLLSVLIYGLLRMAGLCTSPAIVRPSPVGAWLQERAEARK